MLAMPGCAASPAKIVFLAECAYDLKQERRKLQSFLEERNWQVRPISEYPTLGREDALRADLRESVAFVQLLERLREKQKPAPAKTNQSRKILVRVVIRSPKRDRLWDRVFEWIDNQPDMRAHLLEEDEKFIHKHKSKEPCHGFLIVCDGSSLKDERYSYKADMEDCVQIQLDEKDEPPVGLVYCRPPRFPGWSKLLHRTTFRLHPIEGDAPDKLPQFFEDVSRLAK
jgi:hypothetical protein